jgi:hypothetical protein
MSRKLVHIALALALVGLIAEPAGAGKNRRSPAPITYFMNWDGGCDGGGYLSSAPAPNPAACAQYVPTITSHAFRATGQAPFILDPAKTISVDFELDHIVSGAAEFEVVVEATIGKATTGTRSRVIASGTQAVTAETGFEPTVFHYELEPDAGPQLVKASYPIVTIKWTDGATWSQLDMESGNASVTFNASGSAR